MDKYGLSISVPEGKVKEILDRLTEAQKTIYDCYCELGNLGVLTITKKADSGN
ncbi:MAG: hypothetical protein J6N15_01440 [Ruminiclostridium sp.]|nr:hypothetical protein [Ruminiclostridium sp.]